MNKKDFELLIEKYKKDECFDKVDELLEKQIIIFYSNLLRNKGVNFIYRSRKWMLDDIIVHLSVEHIANFRTFFELELEELSDRELFEELETIYENMYDIENNN